MTVEVAEMNKIFPESTLTVNHGYVNTLCFVDGKVLEKSKYSILDNKISLLREAGDSLNLFYDYNLSHTYYFETFLDNYGVIIAGKDLFDYELSKMTNDRVLVFVDGKLIDSKQYEILDKENIALLLNTTDRKPHSVVIYVSEEPMFHDYIREAKQQNEINYNKSDTLIFKNGKFITPALIDQKGKYIQINIEQTADDVVEFFKVNNKTRSLNFVASLGYTDYGPIDDYNSAIPLFYDSYVTFGELAKVCVDDLRPGFFIVENTGGSGRLMIVDTEFETANVKTTKIQNFSQTQLKPGEYYLEVPTAKSIVDYLSDYDKTFRLLPEVLEIFQRIILDEIHDEVERIKNIRSLRKVDRQHINQLIKFLGMDLNIKNLTTKQKQELLDELNSFYSLAGTRTSYNYFNILQDNTRIVDIKQLFTFHKKTPKKTKIYSYADSEIATPGVGYLVGQKFTLMDYYDTDLSSPSTNIGIEITAVDENGGITGFTQDTFEGTMKISNTYPLELKAATGGAKARCNSVPTTWKYDVTLGGEQQGYYKGQTLVSKDFPGVITINAVSGGKITDFSYSEATGNKSYNVNNSQLSLSGGGLDLGISISGINAEQPAESNLVYENHTPGGYSFTVDEDAIYVVEFSGGGGSGGASDSGIGSEYDSPAERGYAGEKRTISFVVTKGNNIQGIIGSGGSPSRAQGAKNSSLYSGGGGIGYEQGKTGRTAYQNDKIYGRYNGHTSSSYGLCHAASGAGGGSTSVISAIERKVYTAAGGDGGQATMWREVGNNDGYYGHGSASPWSGGWSTSVPQTITRTIENLPGGNGGSGGTKTGNGASGGGRNNDGSFQSKPGENGWVKIYKIRIQNYTSKLINNFNIPQDVEGRTITTQDGQFSVKINSIVGGVVKDYSISPESGKPIYELVKSSYSDGSTISYDIVYTKSFSLINNVGGATATIVSTPIYWDYNFSFIESTQTNYVVGNKLFVSTSDQGGSGFDITVDEVDSDGKITKYTVTPTSGNVEIGFENRDAAYSAGTGGTIRINTTTESETQKSEREYVDFYLPEEWGGEYVIEYRIPKIDYGYVNEGTPGSPYPWEPWEADIDYGQTINNKLLKDVNFVDYGYVSEKIKGEWVRYLKWDRPDGLYPTNHVEIQINILSVDDYDEVVNRFYTQFYNLASTVLYIHRLVTIFNFGNNSETGLSGDGSEMGDGKIFLGVMTSPMFTEEIHTLTSDPARQPQ